MSGVRQENGSVQLEDRSHLYVDAAGRVDVAKLIAAYSHEEHAQRADNYFGAITDHWAHVLRKPFSNLAETPPTLVGFSAILQLIEPRPNHVVVDFGCGTGWLSQALALLGCRPIGVDISKSALDIARGAISEHPYLSKRPIDFCQITPNGIPLETNSVDRIICFDSFHHVADQAFYLSEFYRILKPGGIAGFHEPGPNHSQTPMSQYEMRQHAVIENDILIEYIRSAAMECGFEDMIMALTFDTPPRISYEEYRHIYRHPDDAAVELGRSILENNQHRRVFSLKKSGVETLDSRTREAFDADIAVTCVEPGPITRISLALTNTGQGDWLPSGADVGCVNLGLKIFGPSGTPFNHEPMRFMCVPHVRPGQTTALQIDVETCEFPEGYRMEVDLVAEQVVWLSVLGRKLVRF